MVLLDLPPVREVWEPPTFAGADHPMRKVTRGVAFDGRWDEARRDKVSALFDSMAAEWGADHDTPGRYWGIEDGLERGGPDGTTVNADLVVELGSGTGLGTAVLAERFDRIVAVDLSIEMLRRAPEASAARLRADSSCLPIRDGAADLVVLVNMLLFPSEVDRILAPEGSVLWTNTLGDQTPIHLSAADVLDALPGEWTGSASRAGCATWLVARRS